MATNKKDFATGVVSSLSGTTLTFQTGYGQTMPTPPFYLTLSPPGQLTTLGNSEKILVTSKTSAEVFECTRAQGDTTSKTVVNGWLAVNSIYTADIDDAIGATFLAILPVGATWYGGTNSANPSTYLPGHSGTTWIANAAGEVIVGKAASGTFATAGATGGEETHLLTAAESGLPAHTHNIVGGGNSGYGGYGLVDSAGYNSVLSGIVSNNTSASASSAHNNLQPYKVEYIWKRTA